MKRRDETVGRTMARVPTPEPHGMESRFVEVDGLRTHYFEGGEGPPVVLLHSGEFGASAELSWEYTFAALTPQFRVVAPDWLGFGQTAKVYDFEEGHARRLRHMARFLQIVGVSSAHFLGNSMSATYLLRDAASDSPVLRPRSIVAISGGGFVPANEWRQALVDYDGTIEAMTRVLRALFVDDVWSRDPEYVRRRHVESLRPGAWECAAAARLVIPTAPRRPQIGIEDTTPYERMSVRTLLITGNEDRLKPRHYGRELSSRIPGCDLVEVEGAAHCSHIERPSVVNAALVDFFRSVD